MVVRNDEGSAHTILSLYILEENSGGDEERAEGIIVSLKARAQYTLDERSCRTGIGTDGGIIESSMREGEVKETIYKVVLKESVGNSDVICKLVKEHSTRYTG